MAERIYYTDSYCREFTAKVVGERIRGEHLAVELDRSAFYPTSGGQPNDLGWLDEGPVIDVVEEGEVVIHLLPTGNRRFKIGEQVTARIDWDRRFDHMQQHTGQHILSQAFIKSCGLNTVSFHLGSDVSTIDLATGELTRAQLEAAETLANQTVFGNLPVRIHFLDSSSQSALPVRKPSDREGTLRVIEIEGFDYSACGGTHCATTGEVGLIKLRRWERVKQQARVEFHCGWRTLRDFQRKSLAVSQLSQLLSASENELVTATGRLMEKAEELRKTVSALREAQLDWEADTLARNAVGKKGLQVVFQTWENRDVKELRELARRIVDRGENRVVLFGLRAERPSVLFARSPSLEQYDARKWIEIASPFIGGRGGGMAHQAQAGGTRPEGLEAALQSILDQL